MSLLKNKKMGLKKPKKLLEITKLQNLAKLSQFFETSPTRILTFFLKKKVCTT